jgi:uncharacterized protein
MPVNNNPKYLIVSFHDLSPHSQQICESVLNDLRGIGIEQTSLLATPQWHDKERIDAYPACLEWMKNREAEGHEISLHGYTHKTETVSGGIISQVMGRIYTASEGEFYQIEYQEAQKRIHEGLSILRSKGLTIEGFTPPAWLLSPDGRRALVNAGLIYSTELQHIDLLSINERLFAPTIVFSSRSAWRRLVSVRWVHFWAWCNRNRPIIRLAIHPIDWQYPTIRETIMQIAEKLVKTRTPITYQEFARRYSSESGRHK